MSPMNAEPYDPSSDPIEPRPPQYSLRSLFYGTTIFALICGLCFALPDRLAGNVMVLLAFLVPATLLGLVVYGNGSLRAFCIGGLVATGPQLLNWSSQVVNGIGGFRGYPIQPTSRPPPAIDEILQSLITLGLLWRPGLVVSWGIGLILGLLFVAIRLRATTGQRRIDAKR
jgi:hypothetical protein